MDGMNNIGAHSFYTRNGNFMWCIDRRKKRVVAITQFVNVCVSILVMMNIFFPQFLIEDSETDEIIHQPIRYSLLSRVPKQIKNLHNVVGISDVECLNQLRMTRDVFSRLCLVLQTAGGLKSSRNTSVGEQVAMFLSILAHHTKNRIVKSKYIRSGRTVSKYFHRVLNAIIKLHKILLVKPDPIADDCEDNRWKFFQNCLGALDGSYVSVTIPRIDQPRYRNRKGQVSVNVLAVCDVNMNFVYVLSGWEGSANDSRVLRDAVNKNSGFRVPRGNYYLCDGGYPNSEGFLSPYRGIRYHLKEWGSGASLPRNKEEYFNMKHARARNVIERSFGVLKTRWAILRSASFYPILVQNRIILACCLLHNFIRTGSNIDPIEANYQPDEIHEDGNDDFLDQVLSTPQSNVWRDQLATTMYNEWRGRLNY